MRGRGISRSWKRNRASKGVVWDGEPYLERVHYPTIPYINFPYVVDKRKTGGGQDGIFGPCKRDKKPTSFIRGSSAPRLWQSAAVFGGRCQDSRGYVPSPGEICPNPRWLFEAVGLFTGGGHDGLCMHALPRFAGKYASPSPHPPTLKRKLFRAEMACPDQVKAP